MTVTPLDWWRRAQMLARWGDAMAAQRRLAEASERYFWALDATVRAMGALPENSEAGSAQLWEYAESVGRCLRYTGMAVVQMTVLCEALPCFRRLGPETRALAFRGQVVMTTPRGGRAAERTERSGR